MHSGGSTRVSRPRLGIAAALLGDPAIVMRDEPVNGLDPEGVLQVRKFLRRLANEGRSVMPSSRLMSEMALIVNQLVITRRRQLLADTSPEDFTRQIGGSGVKVVTDQATRLRALLAAPGVTISSHLVRLLQQPDPLARLTQSRKLTRGGARLHTVVDGRTAQPLRQRHRMDAEVNGVLLLFTLQPSPEMTQAQETVARHATRGAAPSVSDQPTRSSSDDESVAGVVLNAMMLLPFSSLVDCCWRSTSSGVPH